MTRRQFLISATGATGVGLSVASAPAVSALRFATAPKPVPGARRWIEEAMDVVRVDKPTPPAQARLYAAVAEGYNRALRTGASTSHAGDVARQLLIELAPLHASEWNVGRAPRLSTRVQNVARELITTLRSDGFRPDDPAKGTEQAPTGLGYWVRRNNVGPFAPSAGLWKRWVVGGQSFAVPAPARPGDSRYEQQKQAVIEASARRDAAWVAAINFWGGTPGTEGPSGIWLNRLWTVSTGDAVSSNDARYALVQARLAKAVADAFIECWKVKYTYWTERPDMVIPGLVTAMANTPFPAYVSGHSTISATAATVLQTLAPSHNELWLHDAETARDSRLYAGIHFPMDNEEGFALGKAVGVAALAAYNNQR